MPELPEVETIKNELAPYIIGRRLTGLTFLWKGIVKQPSVEDFRSRLIGQKITSLSRRGKYLIASLTSDDLLILHLKMSGSLLVGKDSSEPPIGLAGWVLRYSERASLNTSGQGLPLFSASSASSLCCLPSRWMSAGLILIISRYHKRGSK